MVSCLPRSHQRLLSTTYTLLFMTRGVRRAIDGASMRRVARAAWSNRSFMRRFIAFVVVVVVCCGANAIPAQAQSAQSGVAALLTRSADAWNHGNLDAFMTTYEDSPQTEYISAKAIVHGYAAIRARYAGHYHPGQMGMLSMSDLAVRPLGADYAVATARWHLARPAAKGGNVSGLFSLVLHRNAAGWHIITDHTP
jgi:ketosteroid isomerase-like protein